MELSWDKQNTTATAETISYCRAIIMIIFIIDSSFDCFFYCTMIFNTVSFKTQELAKLREIQEEDSEFRRRVRDEIRRISKGDADEDIIDDEEHEREQEERRQREEERRRKREANPLRQIFTGSILLRREVQRGYLYMMIIALLWFLNIVAMFNYLRVDVQYTQMTDEVHLLREKSLRIQELRYSKSSHSVITRELKSRNIDLRDPSRPRAVIE